MEHDAAHQLHGVGAHAQHAVSGLPHGGEGLRQNVVQRFAVGQTLLELRGLGLQLGIRQLFIVLLQRGDLVHDGVDALQLPLAIGAENLGKQSHISVSFLLLRILYITILMKYTTLFCLMQKNFCEQLSGRRTGLRLCKGGKRGILNNSKKQPHPHNEKKEFTP